LTMQTAARRAVSPVIATLLLIAIAVAAGIIVYVYVNSLAGGLTGGGGGQQVSGQVSMDSYSFTAGTSQALIVYLRNTGASTVTLDSGAMFLDGVPQTDTHTGGAGTACSVGSYLLATGSVCYVSFSVTSTAGTSHTLKVLDVSGGTYVFPVTSGRSG
jgi:archaeal type IV pilus assembly protein PilA